MIVNLLSFASVMATVGGVLGALLILMIMITVHEFGHYIVGKIFKFKINEFAIGMGPAIYKRQLKSGEQFSIRALPVGGFCAFEGEDDEGDDPNAFNKKKPWQRILVLLAGATMNYLLALLIIIISMGTMGQSVVGGGLFIDDPAYSGYSLENDDIILSIKNSEKKDKTNIYITTDFISALNHKKKGEIVYVDIIRDGEKIFDVPVKLRADVECKNITMVDMAYDALGIGSTMMLDISESKWFKQDDYIKKLVDRGVGEDEKYHDFEEFLFTYEQFIGVIKDKKEGDVITLWVGRKGFEASVPVKIEFDKAWEEVDKTDQIAVQKYFGIKDITTGYYTISDHQRLGFFTTIGHSFEYSFKIGGMVLQSLGQIITGAIGLNAVGGTVTTIVTTTEIIAFNPLLAFEIAALIGVNLAVFNLLPIPALDGSRIVFCIIEWIRKKPINRKVEGIIHGVGLVFILAFAVLVDVLQFI
ncbi:MAG: site-2 protease family protein [Clostridia bacterium]|nr:site-2 protease family protein [Clostridia bacterium]